MSPIEIITTSAFGLESVVRHEVQALGYESTMLEPGRQLIVGDESTICRTNLFLRCAERILIRVGNFDCADFDQLFEGTKALEWERWIPRDGAFPVKAKSIKSQLTSLPAIQRSVKKALVERLSHAHSVQELPEDGPTFAVEAALLNNQLTLTIDTTGVGLHKRGYRPAAGQAPLRETLAAAMIQLSQWKPDLPFWDPFCGSGTLPIEAAMIGRNMAAGINRTFVAESWPQIPATAWSAAREEAADLVRPGLEMRIMGTDSDARVLVKARSNATAAGVENDIHFQQKSFAEISSQRKYGCLICNPPYGQRLNSRGEEFRQLEALYRSFPDVLRRLPTWSHYILTSMPSFEAMLGQKATKRRKLYNGRIECQLYQYFGPRPGSQKNQVLTEREGEVPAETQLTLESTSGSAGTSHSRSNAVDESGVRVTAGAQAFGGLHKAAIRQSEEFANRLRKRDRHLRRWPSKGIHCYRLYERDVPDVPLVVDRYEDWLHIAEFDRPHERTPAQNADWLDLMKKTAADALNIDPANVAMKQRRRQRSKDQYQRIGRENRELAVRERDLKFLVNLHDYLDTGLFLDHRETRRMVREEAQGRSVLNLFAYTGSFSVYAAAGGAASTHTVDLSKNYLEWAERNFALNRIHLEKKHRFTQSDALTFLRDLHPDVRFGLVVVDPPTFSNSKDLREDWDVQRDHPRLLKAVHQRLTQGGTVYFSTNFRRFKFDAEALPYAKIHEISRQTVPEDFRNRRIHRCWRLEA